VIWRLLPVLIWVAVTLLIDPGVYYGGHTPKQIGFLALMASGIAVMALFAFQKRESVSFQFAIIEALILARIVWLAATHPYPLEYVVSERFWILIGLLFLCLWTRNSEPVPWLWVIAWVSLFQAGLGIYQYMAVPLVDPDVKTSVIGTIIAPNGFGLLMAIGIVAWLGVARKSISIPMTAILLVALYFNGSRGALLALIAVGALTVLWLWPRKSLALAGIIIIAGTTWFAADLDPESTSGRWMIWNISAPMVVDHPITGVGHGRLGVEYLHYQADWLSDPAKSEQYGHKAAPIKQAHNEYLQAFCESGVIGGLLFLGIWLLVLYHIRPNAYSAILGLILLHSLIDTPQHVLPLAMLAYALIPLATESKHHIVTLPRYALPVIGVIALLSLPELYGRYQAYRHWQIGQQHASQWNWSGAVNAYDRALVKLPNQGELHFHMGAALVHKGEITKGLHYLETSKKRFNDRNIWLNTAHAYTLAGKLDSAENEALMAKAMFPDHLAPDLILARIWHRQGRFEESKGALRRCITQDVRVKSEQTSIIANEASLFWTEVYGHDPAAANPQGRENHLDRESNFPTFPKR
jgi:tetratricopeptide (TPR) repeat protein